MQGPAVFFLTFCVVNIKLVHFWYLNYELPYDNDTEQNWDFHFRMPVTRKCP